MELARHLPGGVSARWERDKLGRPVRQSLEVRGQEMRARVYRWEPNDRLKQVVDSLSGPTLFEHDALGTLVSASFEDAAERAVRQLRMPDAVGNLFRTNERKDRKYGPGGALLESRGPDGVTTYEYDREGNLTRKRTPSGEWQYTWNGAGRLVRVQRPDGSKVAFGYDALGRRVWKQWKQKRTRWVWDGNVPLHEWVERVPSDTGEAAPHDSPGADTAQQARQAALLIEQPAQGPPPTTRLEPHHLTAASEGTPEQPITWLFEPESFTPAAKLIGEHRYSIITDHLGVPTTMVDDQGRVVWQAEIGIWGDLRDVQGAKSACPFRWPGQYEDEETGLYYNRFRYYDPDAGGYVSQDPIRLLGGSRLYSYPPEPQKWVDPLGLSPAHLSLFSKGASVFLPETAEKEGIPEYGQLGRPDGLFVTTPEYADQIERESRGNRETLKQKLGIPKGDWNEPINRIDIPPQDMKNLRMSTGKEKGANKHWIPGGYTSGGVPEAVIDPIPQSKVGKGRCVAR